MVHVSREPWRRPSLPPWPPHPRSHPKPSEEVIPCPTRQRTPTRLPPVLPSQPGEANSPLSQPFPGFLSSEEPGGLGRGCALTPSISGQPGAPRGNHGEGRPVLTTPQGAPSEGETALSSGTPTVRGSEPLSLQGWSGLALNTSVNTPGVKTISCLRSGSGPLTPKTKDRAGTEPEGN